jgi:hypothetical protein
MTRPAGADGNRMSKPINVMLMVNTASLNVSVRRSSAVTERSWS